MMTHFLTRLTVLLIVTQLSFAKPLQSNGIRNQKSLSNAVESSDEDNKKDSTRVGRQNVQILDPLDYENDVQMIDKEEHDFQPKARPSTGGGSAGFLGSVLSSSSGGGGNRDGTGRGGLSGIISSILGSSSGSKIDVMRSARIRRQAEQIVATLQKRLNETKSAKQQEELNGNNSIEDNDTSDEDEPPGGGDGMGGGILGLLAGLSGEGGQSDLGTLLTTVGSIVANLSGGEGFDLNTLIGSAVALLAGILGGDGMQNIGTAIGGYLVTALEGITGGGAMNNGAFFGNLAATLLGGISAAGNGDSSETQPGSDSGSFISSLISALLGGSSG